MDTGQKILIIEDEKKISEIVKAYLEKEGFIVTTAETGEDGLKLLIREGSDIPVIMLTAKSDEEARVRGLGIGADDYVIKPFSPRELVARVKAHLRRAVKARRKIYSYNSGSLKIDIENHEAFREGNPIVLTPTEFKILFSLAENPGRVLSRDQLVTIVLGYDFEGYDRTIDAHVKNLRHKVEKDSKSPDFIQTVYGIGYKFIGTIDEE
jgi:DNA-binding response OmpR family regulator